MTRDIRQLINQGVPAIKLLADTMGVAQSEVLDLASEGEISFEVLQQAFADATSAGGMFADGMEKQANTLAGVWSTFKDNVSIALGEVGESLAKNLDIKQLTRDVIANIQAITSWFTSLSADTQATMITLAAVIGAGGPVLYAMGALTTAVSALAKGFIFLSGTAIPAAVSAFETLYLAALLNPLVAGIAAVTGAITALGVAVYKDTQDTKRLNKEIEKLTDFDVHNESWMDLEKQLGTLQARARQLRADLSGAWIPSLEGEYDALQKVNGQIQQIKQSLAEKTPVGILKSPGMQLDALGLGLDNLLSDKTPSLLIEPTVSVEPKTDAQSLSEGVQEIYSDLAGQLQGFKTKASLDEVFPSFDLLAEKTDAIRSALSELIAEGVDPMSARFQNLAEQIKNPFKGAENPINRTNDAIKKVNTSLSSLNEYLPKTGKEFEKVENKTSFLDAAFGRTKQKAVELGQAVQTAVQDAFVSLGETLGAVFSGDAGAGSFFSGMLTIITDFMKQFGKLMIAFGTAKAALSFSVDPITAIAAGTALVAIASAAKSLLKQGPKAPALADGGLAFGPTLAVVGDNKGARANPEVIAPLDKLKGMMQQEGSQKVEVFGRIDGKDIFISNNRGGRRYNR